MPDTWDLRDYQRLSVGRAVRFDSQLRRASAFIPTNITEGCGRNGERELLNFMGIAAGSASEVEYQLILARDLNYINPKTYKDFTEQVIQIKKMLTVFMRRI